MNYQSSSAHAASLSEDSQNTKLSQQLDYEFQKTSPNLLIKFESEESLMSFAHEAEKSNIHFERMGSSLWANIIIPEKQKNTNYDLFTLKLDSRIRHIQPNYKIQLIENFSSQLESLDPQTHYAVMQFLKQDNANILMQDSKPDLPVHFIFKGTGNDPLASKQWGMIDNGVSKVQTSNQDSEVIVGIIDTGIDYLHEDLNQNIYRNPGEMGFDQMGRDKSRNQIDDDSNGFVDDVMGWDFVDNDNKPYDETGNKFQIVALGMNPGHGTHCAGTIAAGVQNGRGIMGINRHVKILPLKFISPRGSGDTAAAIRAIQYGVAQGAKVLSNSWGGDGDLKSSPALEDAIRDAQKKGVLFVVAAGNGRKGKGFNNDTDKTPSLPAAYSIDNIISVAAIDKKNNLAKFSNFGAQKVHIGAPGVYILSTTADHSYHDTLIDLPFFKITWDGTSMATPYVAGAAALYWSRHPNASYHEVRSKIFSSSTPVESLKGKVSTGGKLNIQKLMEE